MTTPTPDQQAMWDALGILGFDLDGDPTPAATIAGMGAAGFREHFLAEVRLTRADHDEAVDEACEAPSAHPAPQACPTRSPYQRMPCNLPDDPAAHAADGHEGSIGAGRVTWPTTVEDHDRWGTRL